MLIMNASYGVTMVLLYCDEVNYLLLHLLLSSDYIDWSHTVNPFSCGPHCGGTQKVHDVLKKGTG